MKRKFSIIFILLLLTFITGMGAYYTYRNREELVFSDSLSEVAVTIDIKELTLFDMAFYIAYLEKEVQKDAIIYNPEQPHKYWNVRTNNQFICKVVEEAVVDMAVHDEIFYRLAQEEACAG